ncbi:hypothetical protein Prudu_011058 [Prunus dulcis]|uniref:Uncharacterized protein n=1 Tax=Prunus dulcis TaxID=3755 RepID=A0A4Y1R9S6_PRUDU|nr:hypothetical protein Prudu_011058 [Prunus dulcis]
MDATSLGFREGGPSWFGSPVSRLLTFCTASLTVLKNRSSNLAEPKINPVDSIKHTYGIALLTNSIQNLFLVHEISNQCHMKLAQRLSGLLWSFAE